MSLTLDLVGKMKSLNFDVRETDYKKCGYHLEVKLISGQVRDFASFMLDNEFYLDFVTAVHVTPNSQIVYQFGNFKEACRINAKAVALDDHSIPTISDIYQGANWHERETHDFYGIVFTGHSDLRTLLLSEEDADLKPLLKNSDKLLGIEGVTRKIGEESEKKPLKQKKEEKSPE